jgi:hypothetical protein
VPRGWDGQRIVVRFDAATHRATAWVGDTQVVEHEGGYTPFEADVTEHVRAGEEARVTVVVNNELSWTSIPPGFVQELDDGRRAQQYFHDFFNYAGLHRSVWLHATPRTRIGDVTVITTEIADATGVVAYRAVVEGDDEHQVRVTVRDADGAEVARADGTEGELRIADVRLWRPGAGYLYTLEVEVLGADGELVDVYPQPFGVRTVGVDGHRFLINGEPFYFTGFGKHEDFGVHGRGHDLAVMVHDFELLEWVGANSVDAARRVPRSALDLLDGAVELDARPLDAPALVVGAEVDAVAPAVRPHARADRHRASVAPRVRLDRAARSRGHRATAPPIAGVSRRVGALRRRHGLSRLSCRGDTPRLSDVGEPAQPTMRAASRRRLVETFGPTVQSRHSEPSFGGLREASKNAGLQNLPRMGAAGFEPATSRV